MLRVLAVLPFVALLSQAQQPNNRGWYRSPAIHGDTIAFTAEGDLWLVGIEGGLARRLTTNPGNESAAVFSPDGSSIAFSADYEGVTEIYTMPATGGLPVRRTYEGGGGRGEDAAARLDARWQNHLFHSVFLRFAGRSISHHR